MNSSPEELQNNLIQLFPETLAEFEEDDGSYTQPLNHHRVWSNFSPVASGLLSKCQPSAIKKFSALINDEVASGGTNENAVTTCLLEHASQVGIRKLIAPYLSQEAKLELR